MTLLFDETLLALVYSIGAVIVGAGCVYWGLLAQGTGCLALGLVLTFLALRPTTVVVGTDGVSMRWLAWHRFFPHGSITTIERHTKRKWTAQFPSPFRTVEVSRGVLLRHGEGATYLICDDDDVPRLIGKVYERLNEHRRLAPVNVDVLHREHQPIAEWMSNLRSLLAGGEGYRANATTPDTLWAVVENPKSDAVARAAAALALRSHLGDEARPRLRVAIDACASPELRVALEAIEDEDDEGAGASLERLARRDIEPHL
jgi:hypothetical protein